MNCNPFAIHNSTITFNLFCFQNVLSYIFNIQSIVDSFLTYLFPKKGWYMKLQLPLFQQRISQEVLLYSTSSETIREFLRITSLPTSITD